MIPFTFTGYKHTINCITMSVKKIVGFRAMGDLRDRNSESDLETTSRSGKSYCENEFLGNSRIVMD